jgi:adenosylcobalamin-dependent ribonucleoside-triphosphate reductase
MQNSSSGVVTPWGEIGYITYKRTYARRLNDEDIRSETEEFSETIERVLKACEQQLKVGFTKEELEKAAYYMMSLKGSVAGRFLWQLGTKTVDKLGLASLQNCAFTTVDHPVRPFTWTFDMLMLGSGVGYNIQREFVYKMPPVLDKPVSIVRMDTNDADFIVPDSRQGWVKLLENVLNAYFYTGVGFSYSTKCVRGKGTPIKSFGGTASGPEDLCWGITQICAILDNRSGKQLRPIDCLDIMNIIGFVVVSGNVRRSAQIAIGDMDDRQYLNAKRWDLGNIPNWRAMSNNSVVCNDFSLLPEEFWEGYKGNGEPYGLINLKLARNVGRLKDGKKYPDKKVAGFNPCAEQSLEDKETCCLAEMFLPNIVSKEELFDVAKTLYRIAKHSLALDCHHADTAEVVHRNMRMGIGVTGYLQATDEQRSWLSDCYEYLRTYDKQYSKEHGWPKSIKLTTTKPSGTLSLLGGVTPGCHPGIYRHFIRRIRMASDSYLVALCRDKGYKVEFQKNYDGTDDKNTVVVEFPCSYPKGTVLAKDTKAVDQLGWVKKLQTDWSDNAVSCTVYYKKEELGDIRAWLLENYNTSLKTVSFLLHSEHGFVQAPYEEISEEEYNELKEKTTPIHHALSKSLDLDLLDSYECANGVCPVK